jgi:ketosteroid isomerase-like protein
VSSYPSTTEEVIRAEQEWLRAHLECDVDVLGRLMAEEYSLIGQKGEVLKKEQILATFRAGERHWDRAESDQLEVRVYGEVAVVTGRWTAKGATAGLPFDYAARYVSVWVKRDGRWQMVSDQSTPIPP